MKTAGGAWVRARAAFAVGVTLIASSAVVVETTTPAAAAGTPTLVTTVDLPAGTQATAMGVSEAHNKVFLADDNTGNLLILDGVTHGILGTVQVGGTVFDVLVSEKQGKVFVASNTNNATSGFNPGTGLISVIDAATNLLITTVNVYAPGQPVTNTAMALQLDDGHDKLYVMFRNPFAPGIAVVNTVTNVATVIPDAPQNLVSFFPTALNRTTQELVIGNTRDHELILFNGATNVTTLFPLDPTGAATPLALEVNEDLNKVYVTMLRVPNQGEIGIMILKRTDMTYKFVGKDDLEPLKFNPVSNHLFSGVQVGAMGAVIDGTTDVLTPAPVATGIFDVDVRRSSDHAYMTNTQTVSVLDGQTLAVTNFPTGIPSGGGVFSPSVKVNQRTGRVYAVPNDNVPKMMVLQDPGPARRPVADFDGNGRTDVGVYRPSGSTWYLRTPTPAAVPWGMDGDIPVPGDYDGDGQTDVAVFRPSTNVWYLRTATPASPVWGASGDIPVPGDYDGDGRDDIAVFRPSTGTWYLRTSTPASVPWGATGDIPVPADYDGDGKTDVAVFRPSTNTWYLRTAIPASPVWGSSGDIPVPADYNGDAKADVAVFRPSTGTWYLRTPTPSAVAWGTTGDVPAPGDYDGDGKAELAVFRPSTDVWYIRTVSPSSPRWGASGDVPLPSPNAIVRFFP